jgi:hypothetical protein
MIVIYIISFLSRGFKLNSIKFINNIYSTRNIYVFNKRIIFMTYYDKSRSQRMIIEYIMRYLLNELSQVLI